MRFVLPIILLACVVGCTQKNPAPVEDKSSNRYSKGQGGYERKHAQSPNPTEFSASVGYAEDAYHAPKSDIVEQSLPPVSEKPKITAPHARMVMEKHQDDSNKTPAQKEVKVETKAHEPKVAEVAVEKVEHKTPQELEQAIDNKAKEQPQGGKYKLASPLGLSSYQWPLDGDVIARYGKTGNNFNEGINIAAPAGTQVKAVANGKVVYLGNDIKGYGNLLIVRHENDILSAYAHLNEISVERGAELKRGDTIGTVGTAGNVKSPQLHFSIKKGKKTINPELPIQ